MIDERKFFHQLVKNDMRIYDNIQKIVTGQGHDYATVFLLDYPYFKDNYKIIKIDLSKQEALDADLKALQQINFKGNPTRQGDADARLFFNIEESKETILDFSQGTVTVL